MIQLINIWTLLILAIALPWVITEVNFRKQVKELDKEFYREARRIDELEKRLLSKQFLLFITDLCMISFEQLNNKFKKNE